MKCFNCGNCNTREGLLKTNPRQNLGMWFVNREEQTSVMAYKCNRCGAIMLRAEDNYAWK